MDKIEFLNRWLLRYTQPELFYLPLAESGTGIVNISFWKKQYYESVDYNISANVRIMIFKKDNTFAWISSGYHISENITLPVGEYYMYIIGTIGCVIPEDKIVFSISRNQTTEISLNFEFVIYKMTIEEENDTYIFTDSDSTPHYTVETIYDESKVPPYDISGSSIAFNGNGSLATKFYNEKGVYLGKMNAGAGWVEGRHIVYAGEIFPPSFTFKNMSNTFINNITEYVPYKQIESWTKAMTSFSVEIGNWEVYLKLFYSQTYQYTKIDSNGNIIESKSSSNVFDKTWIPLASTNTLYPQINYNGIYYHKLYAQAQAIYLPQNIIVPKNTYINLPVGSNYIFSDGLNSYLLKQMTNYGGSGKDILPIMHGEILSHSYYMLNDDGSVSISMASTDFQCSFNDRISDMIEQGKWID